MRTSVPTPPPTAYDTFKGLLPGIDETARKIATRLRAAPGWREDALMEREALISDDLAQRWLQDYGWSRIAVGAPPEIVDSDANLAGVHLHTFVNYELHRRKTFWVDPPLAWMLAQTRLDISGELLRLPFPACAFVLTDRDALELANQLLAQDSAIPTTRPVRVVTAYLQQPADTGGPRPLQVVLYLDRHDGEWPYVLSRDLWIAPGDDLDAILDSHYPDIEPERLDDVFRCAEMKRLLHLLLNAILYTTSAGVEPVFVPSKLDEALARIPKKRKRRRAARREALRLRNKATGEDVFFLPGKIDIRHVEQLQRTQRSGEPGRQLMSRFMVRGYWRRANPTWSDQRPRWIAPHWRGPDLATVIEREYRLKH